METEDWIDCTGDAVTGDTVKWTEGVFEGSYRRPRHVGDRTITAKIKKDSYGENRQQHTFTLLPLHAEGYDAASVMAKKSLRRKARNIYRNGTQRLAWTVEQGGEAARECAAGEKHERGDAARATRRLRQEGAMLTREERQALICAGGRG